MERMSFMWQVLRGFGYRPPTAIEASLRPAIIAGPVTNFSVLLYLTGTIVITGINPPL